MFDSKHCVRLVDRSSQPQRSPNRTPAEVEQQVLEARLVLRVGPDRLADELGVPARTISRILRRNHVPYVFECDPLTGEVIGASKATTFRYERDRPGELLPPVPGKTASRVLQSHVADRVGLTSTFTTNDERGHALPA
jgi:hypothetical protein